MTEPTTCDLCGWTTKATQPGRIQTAVAIHYWRTHGITHAGPEAPCTHHGVHHEHGTPQRYIGDGCRCATCLEAARARRRQRDRAKAYGRFTEYLVDAAPTIARIAELRAVGMPTRLIAERAGVGVGTLRDLMTVRGQRPTTKGPVRVHASVEKGVLAVQPEPNTHGRFTPATGATRRLRALMCLGYGIEELSRRTGLNIKTIRMCIRGSYRCITRPAAATIAALFEELWDKPPTDYPDKWAKASATRARRDAERAGYHPPLAWDDIDDPDEEPKGARRRPTESKLHDVEPLVEDLEFLRRNHVSAEEALRRLGIAPGAAEMAARRAGRRDLANWAASVKRGERKKAA